MQLKSQKWKILKKRIDIRDFHGWLSWLTFMADFHGWLSWMTGLILHIDYRQTNRRTDRQWYLLSRLCNWKADGTMNCTKKGSNLFKFCIILDFVRYILNKLSYLFIEAADWVCTRAATSLLDIFWLGMKSLTSRQLGTESLERKLALMG